MLFSVLKKLHFDGTLEIIDSNDKIYKFGNSNPHVCIRLKNKSIERKLFLNPNLHIGEAYMNCLLYTSDAADDSLRVDLGGRRIIK